MKNNKLLSFVTAAAISIQLIAGLTITASADKTTTYTWDFTNSEYFTTAINAGNDVISDRGETPAIMSNPGSKLSIQRDKVTNYALVAKLEVMTSNALEITVPEGKSASISMQITAGSSNQPSYLKDSQEKAVIDTTGYTKNVFGDAYTAELTCGETYQLDTTKGKPYIGKIVLTVVSEGESDPDPSPSTDSSTDPSPSTDPSTEPSASSSPVPSATAPAATDTPAEADELLAMTDSMTLSFDTAATYTSTQLLCDGYLRAYAASGKNLVVDGSNKTINGHKYAYRIKYGGNGTLDGANSVRVLEVLPDEPGTIEVDFAHASTNASDSRTLIIKQGDSEVSKSVNPGAADYLTIEVKGGQSVYIYPTGAINLYGIVYSYGASNKPTETPVETETPKNAAELDAEALKINAISQDAIYFDIDLPSTGANGSTITWESSNSKYIDIQMISSIKRNYTGVVTRPEDDDKNVTNGGVPVTLTATVKNGAQTVTRTFDVSVRTRKNVVYSNDFQQDVGKAADGTYKAIADNITPATTLEYETQYVKGESWRSASFRGIRIDTLKESRAFTEFRHNDKDTSAYFDKRVMSTKGTQYGNPKDSAGESENFVFYYSEYTPYGGSSTIPLWIELTDPNTGSAPEGIVMMSMDVYVANGANQFNIGLANSSPAQMCRFMLGADYNKSFTANGSSYTGAGYLRAFNNEAGLDFLGGTSGYRVPEGKWVKAIMVANTDSHKWDLYFDGMQIATSLDFRNAEDCVSNIELVLNRSYPRPTREENGKTKQGDPTAAYLIDNIYVENLTEDYAENYWDQVKIKAIDYDETTDTYTADAGKPFLLQYQGTDGLSGNYISWVSSNKNALSITTQRIPVEELANYGYSDAQIAQYNAAGIKDVSVVRALPGNVTKDTEVTLRATIKVGDDELEKEFTVLVKANSSASPTATPKASTGGSGGSGGSGGGGGGSLTATTTKSSGTSGESIASGSSSTTSLPAASPVPSASNTVVSYSDDVFSDLVITEWARDAIMYLYGKDVVNGYGDGTYGVEDAVTREQFVRMLLTALDIPIYKTETPTFSDVEQGSWYEYYVETALELGIVSGISAAEFGTGMPITRQDMAVMAKRALDYVNGEADITEVTQSGEDEEAVADEEALTDEETGEASDESVEEAEKVSEKPVISTGFTDGGDISDYAQQAVSSMTQAGFLSGYEDGAFRPKNTSTRAETAVMISRIMRRNNTDD